jgi:probable HAF family extracellular repeat protein
LIKHRVLLWVLALFAFATAPQTRAFGNTSYSLWLSDPGTSILSTSIDKHTVLGQRINSANQIEIIYWRDGEALTVPNITHGIMHGITDILSDDGRAFVGMDQTMQGQHMGGFYWRDGILSPISLGGQYTQISRISQDGLAAIGYGTDSQGNTQHFYWRDGVITTLSLGNNFTQVTALSQNGLAVIGQGMTLSWENYGFHWKDGVITQLSLAGGSTSRVKAVSHDGLAVIGQADNAAGQYLGFHWKDGVTTELSLGGSTSQADAISADGLAVIGSSENQAGQYLGFYWKNNVITELSLGGDYSQATEMSANGLGVIGYAQDNTGQTYGFHWIDNNIHKLSLGGSTSQITSMSQDGRAVIGQADTPTGNSYGFHSRNGTMTTLSLGGVYSQATAMSQDGRAVIGTAQNSNQDILGFHWRDGVITELSLGGTVSVATSMSQDGLAVIGSSQTSAGNTQAYYWKNGQIKELSLGGQSGKADFISTDGLVVIGTSQTTSGSLESFRWTERDGIKSLYDVLIEAGIDTTGWSPTFTTNPQSHISSDGSVITGTNFYNGIAQSFIMTMKGLITPEELSKSLESVSQQSKHLQSAIIENVGQSLLVARNAITGYFPRMTTVTPHYSGSLNSTSLNDLMPAAGGSTATAFQAELAKGLPTGSRRFIDNSKRKAFYALGHYGIGQDNNFSNNNVSGSAGLLIEVQDYLAIGGGILSSTSNIDTRLGGHNRSQAWGGNILVAYEPPTGLRLYGAATAAAIQTESRRHYMNGAAMDHSKGDTDGIGYGIAFRGGYETALTSNMTIMPYTEWQISHNRIKGYTETGGAFPVTVADQSNTFVTSRFGAEISYDVTPDITLRGRGAWGHRYTDSNPTVATTIGMTQTLPSSDGDRDWIEMGTTLNYKLSSQTTLSADLSGRFGKTAEPAISATIGLIWRW